MDIALTAAFSGLLVLIQHYIPWRKILRRDLPKIPAYILGTLAIIVPIIALCLIWGDTRPAPHVALALVVDVVVSGLAVILAYATDWGIESLQDWWADHQLRSVER